MLELKNVCKNYVINKNNIVHALTDIELSFGTRGLVFVLGPSGSGKSTLLNLIGGLDTPTSGQMLINNENIISNAASLEKYRNNYISFIFQDFNLLSNLTVYENISMVSLAKDSEDVKEKVKEILSKVNLKGYETRYPNELSGGEIQRVAIARALFKNSAIILADEPTGNLNKENSKNICDILKKISLNKLVIVVSHNEGLAQEYADRIIKLDDGNISADIIKNEILSEKEKFHANSYSISKKDVLKLSLKNIFDRKIRFFISLFSIIVAFSVLSLSLAVAGFDRPYVDAKNIKDNNVDKYLITSNRDNIWIYNDTAEEIIQYEGLEYIRNGVVKSINDVIEMGYDIYPNYSEITDESIILSDFDLYLSAQHGEVYYISNDEIVDKAEFNLNNFNEYYIRYNRKSDEKYLIPGIYHSYYYENKDNPIIYDISTDAYDKAHNNFSEGIFFHTENSIYETPSYVDFRVGSDIGHFKLRVSRGKETSFVNRLDNLVTEEEWEGTYFTDKEYVNVSTKIVPEGNEVYLTLKVYNCFFNERSELDYYFGDQFSLKNLLRKPIHIDEPFNLEIISNGKTGEKLVIENLVVKGILPYGEDEIILSKDIKKRIDDFTKNNSILVKTSSVKNNYSFLKKIYNDGYYANYYCTEKITAFQDGLSIAQFISSILVVLMIILIVLINTIIISQIVKSKDKENGVLRAIGVKKSSILNIYLLQSIFIIIISYVISLIVDMIFIKVINAVLVNTYSPSLSLVLFRGSYALIILAITVFVNFVISYISLHKAISKNPIDVIRLKWWIPNNF